MDGGAVGLYVLAGIAVVLSLATHAATRHYFLASISVGVLAVVAVHAIGFVQLGRLEPFAPGAAAVSFAYATVIALAIGIPFAIVRVARKGGHGTSSHYDPQ